MIRAAIEAIQALTREASFPRRIDIPGERRSRVCIANADGTLTWHENTRRGVRFSPAGFEDAAELVLQMRQEGTDPRDIPVIVCVSEMQVVFLLSYGNHPDSMVMRFALAEPFAELLSWDARGSEKMNQARFLSYLRRWRHYLANPAILKWVAKLRFKNSEEGKIESGQGLEWLSVDVKREMLCHDGQDIPDNFVVSGPLYSIEPGTCDPDDRILAIVKVHVDIDPEQKVFSLRADGDELRFALDDARSTIISRAMNAFDGVSKVSVVSAEASPAEA